MARSKTGKVKKKNRDIGANRIDHKLDRYARRRGLRKGSKSFNAYRYGTVSKQMARKYRRGK